MEPRLLDEMKESNFALRVRLLYLFLGRGWIVDYHILSFLYPVAQRQRRELSERGGSQ